MHHAEHLVETIGFRPDIQALRAIAVTIVVLYHAQLPGFSGGYIGVDLFFVISGYLITGMLGAAAERTRSIALGAFHLRRIRRLMPAAVLVISSIVWPDITPGAGASGGWSTSLPLARLQAQERRYRLSWSSRSMRLTG